MAKTPGMGDNWYVGGVDVSGDTNSFGRIGGGPAALDFTDVTQSAFSRLGGERDGGISFVSYFDPITSHPALGALPTTDVHLMYCRGTVLGNPSACMIGKQLNYDGKRTTDGGFLFSVDTESSIGTALEWGTLLTAGKRVDAGATSPATGVDFTTVSTAFGWQAYLQVFAFTGTSVTLQLQDSADNSAFANLGAGGAFTVVSAAPAFQRLASPGATDAVRRYLRVISSGTFSSATFAVMFVRNTTVVNF